MIDGDESYSPEHPLNRRNPERIDEILKLISEIWHKYPDLRLCQLIGNCFPAKDLYYVEDNDLQELLIKYYDERKE